METVNRIKKFAFPGLAILAVLARLALPAFGDSSKLLVHVSLLAVSEESTTAVPLDHDFRSGDRFRLTIRPSHVVHLYLLRRTKDGGSEKIWPPDGISQLVQAGETVTVPERGRFRLDPPAGRERIFLLFTASPLAEPEPIVAPGKGKKRSRMEQIRLREVRLDDQPAGEPGTTFSADLTAQGVAVLEIEVRHR
jgi:Domain of unknown function (DUF4384)